jgi:TolB-like protein/class 3 adenylate cyclase
MAANRRLAAILAADVAGYSRLVGADEEGTLNRLKSIRAELIDPKISEHHGRIVKTTGDGLLVEFGSVIDALRCASEWQRGMDQRNAATPDSYRTQFRIGVHQGDIVVEDGDIFGDGVNVAARLESLAEPGDICVSARVQEDVSGRLDLTFDDIGDQKFKNIARAVRVYRVHLATAENTPKVTPTESEPALALPDKPSIAVLPFQNMSGDPEQEYFADGMVEEIITALSRIRWLFVIARNSSFTYKGRAIDVKQVGRELGVRYVLEGSVRKAGGRVRITAQLIDALTGTHLWADRFDGSLEDIFELQDKVASSVAGVIEPTLQAAEIRRSADRPTTDLTVYDLYLRALPHWGSFEKDRIVRALDLLGQAIQRDPHYGPALALAAHCQTLLHANDWTDDVEMNRSKGIDLARRALRSAPDDPDALVRAAFTLGYFSDDINVALGLIERALTLNPSSASGWLWSGVLKNFAGQPDIAIEHLKTYLRLSPRDRVVAPGPGLGAAHFFKHQFEDAAAILLSSLEQAPGFAMTYRLLASCYAHMGRLDEAGEIVERLRAITPVVIPTITPYRNPEHRELFLSGLRLAMGAAT